MSLTETINVGKPSHLYTEGVDAAVGDWTATGVRISDATAVTIASWYQSANGHGAAFAALASTGRVRTALLKNAIEDAFRWVKEADQIEALNALAHWSIWFDQNVAD